MNLVSFMERELDIADYFVSDDATKMCPVIKAKESGDIIGSGAQGAVYPITVDGKKYAVKKTRSHAYTLETEEYDGPVMSFEDVIRIRRDLIPKDIPDESIYNLNSPYGLHSKSKVRKGIRFAYPKKNEGWDKCQLKESILVRTRNEGSSYRENTFVYSEGENICDNGDYSEALCSMLCSKLFTTGRCANFTDVFSVSACTQESYDTLSSGEKITSGITTYDCTIMELLDGDVYDNLGQKRDMWAENLDYITIQILFAMSVMQRIHGIQHNDLHFGNVMFKKLDDGTRFNGTVLNDADYFSYTIDGQKVYLPNKGYIIKIIDFGFSTKYSHPVVGKKNVAKGRTFADGWRNDYFDISRFLGMFPFGLEGTSLIGEMYDGIGTKRPWEYLIDNSLDGVYYTKPTGKKIVSLGVLGEDDYWRGFFTLNQSITPSKVSMSTFDDYELLTIILGNNVSQNKTTEEELVEFVASVRRKPQSYTLFFLDTSRRAMVISARLMCIIRHYLDHHNSVKEKSYLEDRMYEIETRIEDFKTKTTV